VGMPFEALSAKPVALTPVGAMVKVGVHFYPLSLKSSEKQKTGVHLRTPVLCSGLGYSVLLGCYWLFSSAFAFGLLGYWLSSALGFGLLSFSLCLCLCLVG
jgi:tetrahydromethanopterin S-methyltransferase subunit D